MATMSRAGRKLPSGRPPQGAQHRAVPSAPPSSSLDRGGHTPRHSKCGMMGSVPACLGVRAVSLCCRCTALAWSDLFFACAGLSALRSMGVEGQEGMGLMGRICLIMMGVLVLFVGSSAATDIGAATAVLATKAATGSCAKNDATCASADAASR
jgi:hypothetical protein